MLVEHLLPVPLQPLLLQVPLFYFFIGVVCCTFKIGVSFFLVVAAEYFTSCFLSVHSFLVLVLRYPFLWFFMVEQRHSESVNNPYDYCLVYVSLELGFHLVAVV